MNPNDECLICGAPLVYLEQAEEMECSICYELHPSKTRCVNGHYICDCCHTAGISNIVEICLRMVDGHGTDSHGTVDHGTDGHGTDGHGMEGHGTDGHGTDSRIVSNPADILEHLMDQPFCHMHGPEHHTMVGAALLTAYHNAGGRIGGRCSGTEDEENCPGMSIEDALKEMMRRGGEVPGGACGFWGACGAGISTGMFVSIVTGATPLMQESWGLSNQMTARALERIGAAGGPRCCKRDSYLALEAAVEFAREKLGVEMTWTRPVCSWSSQNNQCIGRHCPFYKGNAGERE